MRIIPITKTLDFTIIIISSLKQMDQATPQPPTHHQYIETQFLFYLFPCYYAMIAFVYRYLIILDTDKLYYVNKIFLEGLFSSIIEHNQSQTPDTNHLPYKKLTPSFLIKYKVSLWNSFLYLVMTFLSFFTSDELFYAAKHQFYSLLYLFGACSWYLSAFVIKKQYERDLTQSLWTHRFFWIFTGVFSITKMFQDYFLPINIIVNILFLIINVMLLVYGLYRPQDNQTVEMIRSPDTPSFIKVFFSTLELNSYVRALFGIEDYTRQSFVEDQWVKDQIKEVNLDEQKLKEIQATFVVKKQTAQNIKDEINLMNTLPRRNIFVDKKLRYLKENDKYKPYYFILTQIGESRFQIQRKHKDFMNLDLQLQQIFSAKNFPKNQSPKIIDIVKKNMANYGPAKSSLNDISEEFSSKAQILEQWLQQLVKQPLFMIRPLLNFLNIDQERSAAFITYFEFSHKSFCSKAYLISKLMQEQSKQEEIRRSLVGYYEGEDTQLAQENISIKKMIRTKFEFKVTVNQQITQDKQYGFWVMCYTAQKGKMKWLLRKYQQNLLQLNQRIQQQCKVSIPFYYEILSSVTTINHKAKGQAYRKYLEKLLQSDKYFCVSLFQFIRFDPIKIQPKLLNTEMSFSKGDLFEDVEKEKSQRESRYFQMWEDKGEFIEVLRIDNLTNDEIQPTGKPITPNPPQNSPQHKFMVRRKGTTLRNKRTTQLYNLRQKLYSLYKGINHVPILDLKDCNKQQLKNRIQNFLLKIQSLPKIQINKDYRAFYENSL